MLVLVTGGTGTVGSAVVRELLRRGHTSRVLTRNTAKISTIPAGAHGAVGDLLDPRGIQQAAAGADAALIITPLSQTESCEGLNAVGAVKAAGVPRAAYLSVHRLESGLGIPHFASKVPIENALKASGLRWTILRPNNFFQNDWGMRDAMLDHGVYPQPLGSAPCSRVDVRDIAEAAVRVLTEPGNDGRVYPLVGPEGLNGPQTAEIWSRHLGRKIAYGGDDLDRWAALARTFMPEWLVEDLCVMYADFQKRGLPATDAEVAEVTRLLGHAPRRFEDFAAETARAWLGQSAAGT